MHKRLGIGALLVLCCSLVTGCSSQKPSSTTGPAYEQALREIAEKHMQALNALTDGDEAKSDQGFLEAEKLADTLRLANARFSAAEKSLLSEIYYDAAAVRARNGETTEAMGGLKSACELGFGDISSLTEDPSFQSLRDTPDFKSVTQQIIKRAANLILSDKPKFVFEFELMTVDQKQLSSRELAGKITLIDFWGTWCPPCHEMTPTLNSLYHDYQSQGLEIVGITYEAEIETEPITKITNYLAENKVPYRCVIGDEKTKQQVPGFDGFPTLLLMDRKGTVRAMLVGVQHELLLRELVEQLVKE